MHTIYYQYETIDIFIIDNSPNYILYAPTIGLVMEISKDLNERIRGFFHNNEEFSEFKALLQKANTQNNISIFDIEKIKSTYFHLALGLTQNCNLRCLYCHADAGKNKSMRKEVISAAIEYAATQCKERNLKGINISFAVGGEPTMAMDRLKFTLLSVKELCMKNDIAFQFSMTTNGFYDTSIAYFLANNINNLLVSLDGIEHVHNIQRPSRSGLETFHTVMKTLDIFYEVKKNVNVRATVSKFGLDYLNQLIELLFSRFGSQIDLVLEPLVPLGRGAHLDNDLVSPPDLSCFGEAFIRAKKLGASLGIKVKTSALNIDRLVKSFCGAMFIPSFTVTTDGIVTTCERDVDGRLYKYGYYNKDQKRFIINEELIKKNKQYIQLPLKCHTCYCKYHCAGDCPDVRNIGYNRCELNKYLLKNELISQIRK